MPRKAASHGGAGEGGRFAKGFGAQTGRPPARKGAKTPRVGHGRATARWDRGHSHAQVVWACGAGQSGARMRGGSLESEACS
jgi:hypothetical protein